MRWDIKEQKKNSEIEFVVIKTIASFMNGQGGVLVIGVDDQGAVLGLEDDYKTLKKPTKDGFQLHLRNLIHAEIGGALGNLVDVCFQSRDGKDACMVPVQPGPKPVWVTHGGKREFYLRTGNQTRPLDSKETTEYVKMRWS